MWFGSSRNTSSVTENAVQRRSRKAGYEGKTATSIEEAERLLDQGGGVFIQRA